MKIDKTQKGFGAVEILLVIVVIGLIMAVGWLFMTRQSGNDNTAKSNSTTSNSKTQDVENTNSTEQNGDIASTPATDTFSWSGFSFSYYRDWKFAVDDTSYDSKTCQGACASWGGQSQLPGVDYNVRDTNNIGVTARVDFNTSGKATPLSQIKGDKIAVDGVNAVKTVDTNGGNIGGYSLNAYFDKTYNNQQRRYAVWVYGDPNKKDTIDTLFNTIVSSWKWQ